MSLTPDDSCKLSQKGWVDSDEEKINNIPKLCPRCGSKRLWIINAANLCGVYQVYCLNLKCRWMKEYEV